MAATGVLSIGIALIFPMERYQSFLYFIGAMFIPLFGVVLTDYFLVRERRVDQDALNRVGGPYWYSSGYHGGALVSWASGFAAYESIQLLEWPVGGSIPSMLVAGALYYFITPSER